MNREPRRTNVVIRLTPCRSRDKGRLLWNRLDAGGRDGALVARVRDHDAAKNLLDLMNRTSRDTRILAANQSESEQARCVSWFRSADRPALIIAGGCPIPDRDDIRQCYIMNLPPSLAMAEADIAAGGRDALDADAEFFASRRDLEWRLAEAANAGDAVPEEITRVVAWMENDGCARQFLAARHGVTTGKCGNCGWCLGKRAGLLPPDE